MKRRGRIWISVLFLAGFLGGIVFIYLCGDTYLSEPRLINRENLQAAARTQIDARALFFYLLRVRGKWLLLLWLIGYTVAALPVLAAVLAALGFLLGACISLFVIRMRMLGILLFLAAVLPQAFVYVPLVWILACQVFERGWARFRRAEVFAGRQTERAYLRTAGLGLALLLVGLALESCVNPILMRAVVNYFF